MDAQGDAQVGRRRAAEDGQRQGRADRADATFEIALVLGLRIGDPAEGTAEVDAGALGGGLPEPSGLETGVGERQLTRDQAELAEAVELAGRLGVHVAERIEVVDLGRDVGAERTRIEPVDLPHRRATRAEPGPKGVDSNAGGRDDTEPGDPDSPFRSRLRGHAG